MTARVSRAEYFWPLVLAALLFAGGSLPYLYARMVAPEGMQYMELLGRGPDGGAGYFMFIRQAWEGHWLFTNRMTSELTPYGYLSPEWFLLGWVAKLPGSSIAVAFHLSRAMAVFGYAMALYWLATLTLDSVFKRRAAVSLIMLCSGWGWILAAANAALGLELSLTPDALGVSVPAYLVNKPHFVFDHMFAILKYGCLIAGWQSQRARWFVLCGLAATGQSAIRPFHLPETGLLLAMYPLLVNGRAGAWSWKPVQQVALALIPLVPAVLILGYFSSDRILANGGVSLDGGFYLTGWGRPKSLVEIMVWLGWPALLFAASLVHWLRVRQVPFEHALLAFWLLAAWGFTQLAPYYGGGQEAVLPAYSVVPVLLAIAWTLPALARWIEQRLARPMRSNRVYFVAALILVGMASPLLAWTQMVTALSDPRQRDAYYLPQDVKRILDRASDDWPADTVILAARDSSRYIPKVSSFRVVSGHYMYTPNIESLAPEVERYFRGDMSGEESRAFLRRHGVALVLNGPYERKLGEMSGQEALSPLHSIGEVELLQVNASDARE